MDSQRCVWDLQLTRIPAADASSGSSASGSTSSKIAGLFKRGSAAAETAAAADSAGGEYALQVVGKAGEVPVVPATIQLDIYHQDWGEGTGIRFKLQSDSQGFVRLGSLSGIRSLKAQFLAPPGTAAAGDVVAEDEGSVLGLQLKQQEALFEDSSTAVRTWQLLGDVNVQPLQSLVRGPAQGCPGTIGGMMMMSSMNHHETWVALLQHTIMSGTGSEALALADMLTRHCSNAHCMPIPTASTQLARGITVTSQHSLLLLCSTTCLKRVSWRCPTTQQPSAATS